MPRLFGQEVDEIVDNREKLRTHYDLPSHYVSDKEIDHVDALAARFIEQTGLVFLSTQRADGQLDISPRGDPPGFMKLISPTLLALPDRPGNHRVDTFENILQNPQIGLICVIPGHRDTLRISGEACLVCDEKLAETCAISGKPALSVLLIKVTRVLCHCPKAFVRGGVWAQEKWPDTTSVPFLAEMMSAHGKLEDSVAEIEGVVRRDGENRLY